MPATASKKKPSKRASAKKRSGSGSPLWPLLWPPAVAIVATFGLIRLAALLTLAGPSAFTLLYPWVAFARERVFGMSFDTASQLAQAMLYLQFPVYGAVAGFVLASTRRFSRALLAVLALHLVGLLAVVAARLFVG